MTTSGVTGKVYDQSLLLHLTETWNHHIDQGKVIGAIFIDFRKAFDSVCPIAGLWN